MKFAIVFTRSVFVGCLTAGALAAVACADGRGLPTSPSAQATESGLATTAAGQQSSLPSLLASSERSGMLEVTKECSQSSQGFCTITSSNVKAIEVGTRVVYLHPEAVGTPGGSAVILDVPGPGNNKVFGNCELSATTQLCTFAGGTGKFTHFQAKVIVSRLGGADFGWRGDYSFRPQD